MTRPSLRLSAAVLVAAASIAAAQAPVHKALDPANLDTTCAACGNFYNYANGGWAKRAQIPASYPMYGGFLELNDNNEAQLRTILEAAAADVKRGAAKPGSSRYRVGAFYASCMDTTTIDKLGLAPLSAAFRRIDGITDSRSLARALNELEFSDGLAPFGASADQDAKDSKTIIAQAGQGGLVLPDRDYYLTDEAHMKAVRTFYAGHVMRMLQLSGLSAADAQKGADDVLRIETAIANASYSRVKLRDPSATYHKMTVAEFNKLTPHMDWNAFITRQGGRGVTQLIVAEPEFFSAMDSLVANVPVSQWKNFLRWRAIHANASALSTDVVKENFTLSQQLSGSKVLNPRWQRCIRQTDGHLGDALGQEYVKVAFTPAAKARALSIINDLTEALGQKIKGLEWMDAATKQQASNKLVAYQRKIGYPDTWKNYSSIAVSPSTYLENRRAATRYETARNWAKIGKPVDRNEWGMTPPTVNAYYNPLMNEIVFPAGILQFPFFDASADDAFNYGAMGAVVGHEMTHGFDDQGRQYDAQGNLRDWWTPGDNDRFNAQAKQVENQFASYTMLDTATHVNGKLTLGENIADLGGLKIAYAAMENHFAKHPEARRTIDGWTPEQRFFLAWAQVWRSKARDEYTRMLVSADEHAPNYWRVNGPLSNMPEFAEAFKCMANDPMVRAQALRARIW
ncbi:MAG: peptidase [Gemmatimonadetes bacterium]|nr:peptidase [Gemmatimonadota bacterium]